MSGFTRALVPAIALGIGTWLGMGRPDAQTALAAGAKAVASVAGAAHDLTPHGPPTPPLDRRPGAVDASAIPDPASPFPRLNPDETAQRAWLRPFDRVCANACALPFADNSVDLILSNFPVSYTHLTLPTNREV